MFGFKKKLSNDEIKDIFSAFFSEAEQLLPPQGELITQFLANLEGKKEQANNDNEYIDLLLPNVGFFVICLDRYLDSYKTFLTGRSIYSKVEVDQLINGIQNEARDNAREWGMEHKESYLEYGDGIIEQLEFDYCHNSACSFVLVTIFEHLLTSNNLCSKLFKANEIAVNDYLKSYVIAYANAIIGKQ